MVKAFAKQQLKLLVNSDGFKPAIQDATRFAGEQFDKIKPQLQSFTQTAVKETTEAGLKVANVFASPALKGSFQAFTAVGVPAAAGLAQAMAPLALRAIAVYEAFHLVAEAVNAARNQISEMVALADKAQNFQVSAGYLQLFEGEARKLKVTTEELDTALAAAFNATKEKSPIDLGKWEAGKERITDVELALRVYNQELAKAAGTQLQGVVLFRDADSQEGKITAVLTAMIELDKIGQHAASLDVGEKMFGAAFVDRIRQGKTSAESILSTMDNLKKSGDGIFPDELVSRAKQVDEQLKLSEDRLSRSLKPSWNELASVILTIKGYWADVIDLIAKGVELANALGTGIARWELSQKREELKAVNEAIKNGTGLLGVPQVPEGFLGLTPRADLRKRADRLQGEIDSAERALLNKPEGPDAPAKPSRGEGAPVRLRVTPKEADAFDTSVQGVERRTATIKADTAALFQNNAVQAQLRAEFQELTAAAKDNSDITQEKIERYEELRKTMTAEQALAAAEISLSEQQKEKFIASSEGIKRATAAYDEASKKLTELNSASSQVGSALSTAFADAVVEGKNLNEVMSSLIKTLEKAAINSVFSSFFTAPASGGLSPFASLLKGVIPGFAGGTDNAPGGLSWVGEHGPELMNVPKGAQILPSDISRQMTGGSSLHITNYVAGDVSPATIANLQRSQIATQRKFAQIDKLLVSTQRMQSSGVG
ncbi:hypothetical protein FOM02_27035 [Bradyrhizobium sp. SEMIA]|nr:hypothetical protein FOM02_27035 [Bradyrhizobium sp. SEMIA]